MPPSLLYLGCLLHTVYTLYVATATFILWLPTVGMCGGTTRAVPAAPLTSASLPTFRLPSGFCSIPRMKRTRTNGGPKRTYKRKRTNGYTKPVLIGAEIKFHDIDIDDTDVSNTGTIQAALLTIPEGNREEQRIGRKLVIKKILWRYNILLPTTATAAETSDIVRVMLIQDKQANGAQPAVLDILETADYQSFRQLANSQRFIILHDKTHVLNCGAGSGRGSTDTLSYGETERQGTFYKDCNIPIEYDNSASSGVITSIRSNNITCLLISRGGHTAFTSKIRFRFSDR